MLTKRVGQFFSSKFKMNTQRLLFCFCSVLFNGTLGITVTYDKMAGEDFRIPLGFRMPPNSNVLFCKNSCTKDGILIDTKSGKGPGGRYILNYDGKMNIIISQLTPADTGHYQLTVSNAYNHSEERNFKLFIRGLCDGGVVPADPRVYSVTEGGSVTILCFGFVTPLDRKFLCQGECNKFLFETTKDSSSGRYRIDYGNISYFLITVTQLTMLDSGQYRCAVGRAHTFNVCQEFEIVVTRNYAVPLCVTAAVVLSVSLFLLLLYRWRKRSTVHEESSRGCPENSNMVQVASYENIPPRPGTQQHIYQSIDEATREFETYRTLSNTQQDTIN
ncbi:uncharacterized protein LOC129186032 isoform X2 [Dunckerocampus dactyliophorus]|uniref:uncharacterized protein LOC129186032 isoform X2 n=1 Tax=Dunckerocampus dactyliophorus TaxID=161453 RepID=UPI002405A4D3|nr:uncharacterized protein LOC129186032 isoform X2 [Dunckerocampus dactyliophorus]